jgi:hypothetical protein
LTRAQASRVAPKMQSTEGSEGMAYDPASRHDRLPFRCALNVKNHQSIKYSPPGCQASYKWCNTLIPFRVEASSSEKPRLETKDLLVDSYAPPLSSFSLASVLCQAHVVFHCIS